ncbi:MAG: hypothetical protein MUP55_04585 [Candidatus Aenigmarchaeota archaeon]|nr:hypothetical protein [Candidatus Aenigmarchaeota archaeon]
MEKFMFDRLQETGAIEKYGKIFYVNEGRIFRRLLKSEKGNIKQTARGFFLESYGKNDIDVTVGRYCRYFDQDYGTCLMEDYQKTLDCMDKNQYCKNFFFGRYVFVRHPKSQEMNHI